MTESFVFDRSHLALLRLSGADAPDLVNRISTNNVKDLADGGPGALTCFVTSKGRLIDLAAVYRSGGDLWIIGGPGQARTLAENIDRYLFSEKCEVHDESGKTALLACLGAGAPGIVAQVTGLALTDWPAFGQGMGKLGDSDEVRIFVFHSSELPGGGYYLLAPKKEATRLREALNQAGAQTADEQTYERLRIDHGLPASPREINNRWNPLEIGLWRAVDFSKGCYVGQEVVARLKYYDKVTRGLYAVRFDGAELPQPGDKVRSDENEGGAQTIGEITSAALTLTPDGERAAALGVFKRSLSRPGARVLVHPAGGERPPLAGSLVESPPSTVRRPTD